MSPADIAAKARRELIARERATARETLAFYAEALQRVRGELVVVADLVAATGDATERRRLLRRETRLETFEQRARVALTDYADRAAIHITTLQEEAVGQAVGDAPRLMRSAQGPGLSWEFAPPNPAVPASVVGLSADGQPLGLVLREAAGDAASAARRELVVGIIRGKGPREIGRRVTLASGIARHRSLLIARTEALRAYRVTTRSAFQQNTDVVKGWAWQATFDNRTCPACWAMSGTEHGVDESLNSHPGCRCSMIPITRSWADLGFDDIPDARPPILDGPSAFDTLSAADQRSILGPGKFDLYRAGTPLQDFATATRSQRWGKGLKTTPLRDLV